MSAKTIYRKRINHQAIDSEWQKIQEASNSKDIVKVRSAVLSADKLVDYLLKAKGYQGKTIAERVKKARNEFGDLYDKFWGAHKSRNRIVHELGNEVRYYEAQQSLKIFMQVIQRIK